MMRTTIIDRAGFQIARYWRPIFTHSLFLGGLGAIAYAAWRISEPLGIAAGGAILIWIAYLIERGRGA